MAGTTKLSTDIQGALSSIFILYDPAGFQQTTGTLRYLDGSLPQSDADSDWWNMVYRWTDCPVLAGLDLGDYASDAVQSESGSSQELMSRYYIGIRGAWNKDSADLLEGGEELWNKLTAGLFLPPVQRASHAVPVKRGGPAAGFTFDRTTKPVQSARAGKAGPLAQALDNPMGDITAKQGAGKSC